MIRVIRWYIIDLLMFLFFNLLMSSWVVAASLMTEKTNAGVAVFVADNTVWSSSSSSLYSWRSTDGALSAGASIISWRGGDSIIKSASGV